MNTAKFKYRGRRKTRVLFQISRADADRACNFEKSRVKRSLRHRS
jgi:hypothetical protein